jgi:hypothetical protein
VVHRRTLGLAGRLAAAAFLGLALLAPAAALAADPPADPTATEQPTDAPTEAPSDGGISVDPTFIPAPTSTPAGSVLGATGRPQITLPPTDAGTPGHASDTDARGFMLLLLGLATICLASARMPGVRRR